MKKRMLRALSFILAICMVVISVDMPIVATGYDDVAEQLDETIVYEESMEDSCEAVDYEEITENSEEAIISEEKFGFSVEETEVSENAELSDENVDSNEILIQEEITTLGEESLLEYNDVVAMEVIAVDFEETEDSIDADVLIEQYYEGSTVYAAEESQDYNWDNYTDYYIYNQLTADEKKLWDALEIECNEYMEEEIDLVHNTTYSLYHMAYVSIETTEIDAARLQELVHLFLYTHPQYYFLRNGMMYGMSSSSIRVGITGYDKFADGSERKAITNTINALLEDWYEQIDLCATDEEKVLLIHDLICNKVNYNHAIVEDNIITQEEECVAFSQTAYSVFCMDETVCAGYSKAFSWVCNGVGIDNFCVTSPTHAWNKVRVDGSWYNLDSTWNDDDTEVYYYYFMRDDDVFSGSSHAEEAVWEEYLPACTLDSGSTWYIAGKLPNVTVQVAKPEISVAREDVTYDVTISTETPNARIYYTLDGTTPSEAGTKSLIYTAPFEVSGEVEIKAIAVCNEYLDSAVSIINTADVVYTVATGTCGTNTAWSLDSAGHMVIFGTGDMSNYYNLEDVPWYEYIEDIKTLEIQEGVTSIGGMNFWWATNLQSVNISSTVEVIYWEAFASSGLTEVVIPSTVKEIGNSAFSSCESLEKIEFKGNLEKVGPNLFSGCCNLKTIVLPDDYTCIGEDMFYGAYNSLENVTLPDELETIEDGAFAWCKKLKEITVPSSVMQMGDYVFEHCYAMEEAVIEADITTLPIGMFSNCTSLKTVVLPEGYTNIPDYFMESCESITEFTIPETVTSIGERAFYNTGITEIFISDSVTSISEEAFDSTVSITGYPGSVAEKYALENGNEFIDFTEGASSVTFVTDCDIILKPQYFFEAGYVIEPTGVNRAGYTFGGWYTSATTQDETTVWDFANDAVTEDVILYAKWTPNTYILSFNPNYDGAEAIESREIIYDSQYGELPVLTRTGYSFNGWYSAETPEYSGEYIHADSIYRVDGNQTIYAVWGQSVYTLKYDANGGTAEYSQDSFCYEDILQLTPEATREGYTFAGWFSEPEGGEEYKVGTVMDVASSMTLYAHWEANEYTVTLEPDGATLDENEITVTYDSAYGELPTLEKEGYRFKGWMLEDGTAVTASTIVEIAEDHTLYASWQARVYTIILSAGEGSVEPSSKSATFGNEYGELPIPQRVGYSFGGWYTDETEGELISADTVVAIARDHTLYARYEANRYIISFDTNGGLLDTNEIVVTYDSAYGILPVPEQAGCTFKGWYTASEDGEQITAESLVEIAENHTLYAHWDYKYTVETPLASIAGGSEVEAGTKLHLTSATNGAQIYYTTDDEIGVNVSAESGILYEDAIIIDEDITVYAIAVKEQCNSSEVMIVSYTVKDESQDWGDITEADRAEYGFTDASQVPQELWVAGADDECDYTGKAITFADLHVYHHKTLLQPKVDYTIKYSNNTKAGTATITITGKGNYAGTIVKTFKILPLDLSEATVLDVTLPYTGKVQKATTTVTYLLNGKVVTLKKGTDFIYTYPGTNSKLEDYDSNAFKTSGEYVVTITGKGNYSGTTTFNQTITEKYVISKMKLTTIKSQKYTGVAIEPEVKLMNGNVQLVEGTDYSVEYSNNTEVGKATVTIIGMGQYTGTRTTNFNITGTALSKMKLNGFTSSLPWTGNAIEQNVTFSYTTGSGAATETHYLTENVDYTVTYQNNTQIGTATVIYSGMGGYTGTVKKTYKITGFAISKAQVSNLENTMVYDGKEMEQYGYELTYTISTGETAQTVTLQEGVDYTVSYKSNSKVGTASIIFTGINGYTGTLKKTYKITAYDLATENGKISVSDIEEQIYTKGGATPKPIVTYTSDIGSIILTEGKDYTLKYSNHNIIADKDAGKAPTVTITGKGNFKGKLALEYTIVERDMDATTMTATDIVYQNKAGICKSSIVVKDINGKKLAAGTDYNKSIVYTYAKDVTVTQIVNKKTVYVVRAEGEAVDKKDIIPVGAEITATVTGINKYTGTQSVTFRYVAGNMAKASIKVNNQTYTGRAVEPGKDDIVIKIGKTVLEKTDYEIVSYSNNIKKGTAKITIRGIGNYGGEKTVTFKIVSKTMNYTITYDANADNVTGKMKASSLVVGKTLTANTYKRADYVFDGWNTEADGSGVSYVNKEKFSIKEGMTVYGTKITLYAQWSKLFDDEELSRIYSYDILEDEMFEDLEQTATAKDCYDYAIAYLENYDKEAVADFKYYVPNEPNEVEVETTDVLATVYLAAFVSDEAWVYSSDYDTILFDYGVNQSFCYDAAHIGFDVWSGLYDDIYFKMDKTFVWNFGLESNGNYFALARRSPVSGKTVYEMDQNENLIESSCTREELVRMYGRLYEGNLWQDREATALDEQILADADSRRESILNSKTEVTYTGTAYYVSNEGNDENDGLTPETAWASLSKVSAAELQFGDAVFFERGDEFRGVLWAQEGVTYSAYGEGDKPILNTCPENLSGEEKWILYYEGEDGRKIWKYYDETEAYGSMIFNNGESYAKKRYLHYTADEIHLETDITVDFDVTVHLNNYEFMTTGDYDRDDSHTYKKTGELFVRLDEGNPGELYNSIECSTAEFNVEAVDNTTYDNLSLRYGQCAFIYGKENMTVQNCEVCFQGGYYFNPLWADESEAGTGAGDGITIGGWNNKAINNYVHHTYDDGITIEVPEGNKTHSNCIIEGNLIENCNGGILLVNWYDNPENGISMADITINDNYVLYSGDVWSHDVHYPGYFSSCSAFTNMGRYENGVQNITVTDNVFYLCRGTLVSFLVSDEQQDEVYYDGNTYVQYTNAYVGAQRSDEAGYTIMYGSQEKEEFINNIIKDLNGIY